jgi:hypothetical protein
MRCGFAVFFRFAAWGSVLCLVVAVLLGRLERHHPAHRPASLREPAPPRYRIFDGSRFQVRRYASRLLDTETGQFKVLDLPGAGDFDKLCFSPWRDAGGQHHVVGRWNEAAPGATGLARWTYPEGRVLNRISSDLVLLSPPCWFPDRSDRVLFAAADGRLYLLDLRDAGDLEGELAETRPRPVRWATPPAGVDVRFIREPFWPPDASLGGCLVAAVCWRGPAAPPGSPTWSQLWWLRLSPAGTEIVASGRLIEPRAGEPEADEYAPSVGTTSEGVTMLAYLSGPRGIGPAEVRVAPIALAGTSPDGVPRVRAGEARRLAAVDTLAAPAFSSDGRWIYAAVRPQENGGVTLKRIAVAPDNSHDAPLELGAVSGPGEIVRTGGGSSRPPGDRG